MSHNHSQENLEAAQDLFDEALAEKDLHKQARSAVDIANMVMGKDHEDSIGAMNAKGAPGFLEKVAHRLEEIQPSVEDGQDAEMIRHTLFDIRERVRQATKADEYRSEHVNAVKKSQGGFKAFKAA
jgi:gentisate 1,2-dioxygenase